MIPPHHGTFRAKAREFFHDLGETCFAVAFLLMFPFCGAVASSELDWKRLVEVKSYFRVGRRTLDSGGEAFAECRSELVILRLGPGTTKDDLLEFRRSHLLEELDLSDTQVDDRVLEKLPPLMGPSTQNAPLHRTESAISRVIFNRSLLIFQVSSFNRISCSRSSMRLSGYSTLTSVIVDLDSKNCRSSGMHVNLSRTQITALPLDPGNAFYSHGKP